MKKVLAPLLLGLAATALLAQTAAPVPASVATGPAHPSKPASHHRKSTRHVAPVVVAAPEPTPSLGEAELALAQRVYVGHLPCELGAAVDLEAHPEAPGYFRLHFGKQHFQMAPVATTTGAIRLEDHQAGATWLQLANKSMLVSDKLGRRLVDECMNPEQAQVAERLKTQPARSVLDDEPDGAVARQ